MAVKFPALSAGRSLLRRRLLVLISVKGRVDPGVIVLTGRIRPSEKFTDFVNNLTRDLLACGVMLQPNTLSRKYLQPINSYKFQVKSTILITTSEYV
jgi:hypothetical protein